MPTYDYKCSKCGNQIEVFQSIKDDALTKCEACGENTLKRMIGGGVGLIFKGSGFYLTDYKNASSTSEKKSANTSNTKKQTDTKTEATKESSEKKSEVKTTETPKSKESDSKKS